MSDPTPTTFFSYSRTDSEFVLRLATDLRDAGAKVWLDQLDIGAGQLWDSAIEAALRASPRQVVVLSPEAVNSQNVMDEVSYALEEHKQVIPVFYRDCQMPFRLRRVQHIDFRTDYDRGLRDLLRALGVAGPTTVPVSPGPLPSQSTTPKAGAGEKSPAAASLHLDTTQRETDRPPVSVNARGSSKKRLVYGAFVLAAVLAAGIWYMATPARVWLPPATSTPARAQAAVPADQVWIMNANSHMCLSPAGGNDHLNDPIVQFFCDRDPSRGWYFMIEHDNVFKIKNFSNSLCLAVAAPPNFKPEQYTCDSNLSRLWRFVPIDETTFRLVNMYSNLCLGISGGISDKNAEAVQAPCDKDPSRTWKIKSRAP